MNTSTQKLLLIIAFLFSVNVVFSQSNEIKIKFIGNCGLYLTDGSLNLYVDFPYKSGAYKYMEYDEVELNNMQENPILLFTHRHADHYSKKLVKKIKKQFGAKAYGNWNIDKLQELNNVENEFSIQAIKTSHQFTFTHYSYIIIWHGKKIYISGDTGDLEEVSKLQDIDWAFMNPWLFMNAQNEKTTINTQMFGIYHLYPFQKLPEEVPENIVFLKKRGEIITLSY